MNYKNDYNLNKEQTGFVSIVVTLIIMSVLSLIVLSFARQSQREQRQSLDRQLSSQAFYAAESGVNDAIKAIDEGLVTNKTTCEPPTGSGVLSENKIADGIEYSCLLIDLKPSSLIYDSVSLIDPTLTELRFDTAPSKIVISWQNDENKTRFSGLATGSFPAVGGLGGDTGVLRVALSKLPTSGPFSRADLNNNTYHAFLYPKSGGSNTVANKSFVGSGSGDIVDGNCNINKTPLYCSVSISSLGGAKKFFLSMRSIYKTSKVHITAYQGSNLLSISGAQAIIDSTGKASDVLKRLQVRVSASQRDYPAYAVQAGSDICKLYELIPPIPPATSVWNDC